MDMLRSTKQHPHNSNRNKNLHILYVRVCPSCSCRLVILKHFSDSDCCIIICTDPDEICVFVFGGRDFRETGSARE